MRGGEQAVRGRETTHSRAGQDVVRELQEEVQDAHPRYLAHGQYCHHASRSTDTSESLYLYS